MRPPERVYQRADGQMQHRTVPVVLILGSMGSRLVYTGQTSVRAWVPTHPINAYANLNYLQCEEDGVPKFQLEVAGCLGKPPLDFVSPLRNRLAKDGFSVLTFPYDWRQSLLVSAQMFAEWVEGQALDRFNIVGVSTGGLIATQYARMGFGAKIRKFISIGTPFYGMPRALVNLQTGAVINPVANLFLARKARSLIRTFPGAYEVLPSAAYFEAAEDHYIQAEAHALSSHSETCSFLESQAQLSIPLLRAGTEFLLQLAPLKALRNVDTSYIVNIGLPTPAKIIYQKSGEIQVSRQSFGDGSVPVFSQTMGGQHEFLHPGQSYEFQGRHRTMHLNPPVMEQIAKILHETRTLMPEAATLRESGAS